MKQCANIIPLNHFKFHPFMTDKERIKKSLKENRYFTEPINLPVVNYNFRPRNKEKEIQPEMKFTNKSHVKAESSLSSYKSLSSENNSKDTSKRRTHFKSAYSMLLQLGILKRSSSNTDSHLYDTLSIETMGMKSPCKVPLKNSKSNMIAPVKLNFSDPIQLVKQILGKPLSKPRTYYVPKLSDASNPILNAAEKILLKSNTIRRKKALRYEDYLKVNMRTNNKKNK